MKIGILTFHFAHNYGAMLQTYALKEYIRSLGHQVYIINYVPEFMKLKYFQMSKVELMFTFKPLKWRRYIKQRKNIAAFNQFEKEYLNIDQLCFVAANKLAEIVNDFDYIVFGSDQIWNLQITKNDFTYFGDFLNEEKGISYAASSGNSFYTDTYTHAIQQNAHKFKAISVRERNAQNYLKNLLSKKVAYVLDPVFLMDSIFWMNLAKQSRLQTQHKFVLYYSVEDNELLAHECNQYAKKLKLPVYSIHGTMKKANHESDIIPGVGPIEFIRLINDATIIFTNSFHAIAFSIMFGKKAFIRVHSETGNRVTDLLQEAGLIWDGNGLKEIDSNEHMLKNLSQIIIGSKEFLNRNITS